MAAATRVLIVEDDEGFRTYVAGVLEGEGFEVVPAETGERALELAQETAVEVAVVDLTLPGMDGLEVADRLSAEVPVIFVTGDPVRAYAESYGRAREYAVLPKPVAPDVLTHAVRSALAARDPLRHSR